MKHSLHLQRFPVVLCCVRRCGGLCPVCWSCVLVRRPSLTLCAVPVAVSLNSNQYAVAGYDLCIPLVLIPFAFWVHRGQHQHWRFCYLRTGMRCPAHVTHSSLVTSGPHSRNSPTAHPAAQHDCASQQDSGHSLRRCQATARDPLGQ